MAAAQRFFRSAQSMDNRPPKQITTRRSRLVSTGDSGNSRSEGEASLQRLRKPADRTGPPWNQAAILPEAGLRCIALRSAQTQKTTFSEFRPHFSDDVG